MKKEANLHDLAVRLCEGGNVWFKGHSLRAVEVPEGFDPCNECDLDSICYHPIAELCYECDTYTGTKHLLKLAYRK